MNYADYFLIIFDFLNYCNQKNIPIGPGRGSAAGSIVAYAINITKIDPLPYNLLFERFLNPERISMPDIDLDFCIKRRQEVINYILENWLDTMLDELASLFFVMDICFRTPRLIQLDPAQDMGLNRSMGCNVGNRLKTSIWQHNSPCAIHLK